VRTVSEERQLAEVSTLSVAKSPGSTCEIDNFLPLGPVAEKLGHVEYEVSSWPISLALAIVRLCVAASTLITATVLPWGVLATELVAAPTGTGTVVAEELPLPWGTVPEVAGDVTVALEVFVVPDVPDWCAPVGGVVEAAGW
jgi:hypothetical protein